jgi:hypothetical protein
MSFGTSRANAPLRTPQRLCKRTAAGARRYGLATEKAPIPSCAAPGKPLLLVPLHLGEEGCDIVVRHDVFFTLHNFELTPSNGLK